MINPDHFAVTLARAAYLFRMSPELAERKTALRALVALSRLGSTTVVLRNAGLAVEGTPISPTLPFIADLTERLKAHAVITITISKGAPPAEILSLVRRIAADPVDGEYGLHGNGVFVTVGKPDRAPVAESGHEEPGAGALAAEREQPAVVALRELHASPYGSDLLQRAGAVGTAIMDDLKADRLEEAVEALSALIGLEAQAPNEAARRSYGLVLRRSLTRGALQRVSRMVPDERYGAAAVRVLRRAGADATKVLLDQINALATRDERRLYFDALRRREEGHYLLVSMLRHPDWFVVRNAAWLVGEVGVEEVVPELVTALEHRDGRVRQAAAVALAKIGTPETVDHLMRIIRSGDDRLRSIVLSAVKGQRATALVPPLVSAAEVERDPVQAAEYLRALGRIGTPAAVEVLIKAAQPARWPLGRRSRPVRLAAVEGLKLAGSGRSLAALERLVKDRDQEVQDAARRSLAELRAPDG